MALEEILEVKEVARILKVSLDDVLFSLYSVHI